MRLPMFDIMDKAAALLDQRREFYQGCAFELQELLTKTLAGDELLSVSVRVKRSKSLREKILRKHLYKEYDNHYDLLNNLSDLIGLRAECRFLREEAHLFELLSDACTFDHGDGMFSIPTHPNIRFNLRAPQPEVQQNGLLIFRIDGKYHKNGVTAPFELQIKALVHVFWAEVEHQIVYKNNTYMLMDGFIKNLLYSNYDSLKQIDAHLQMIYDHIQETPQHARPVQNSNLRPLLAKTLSDIFMRSMKGQIGFSMRLDKICDILTQYLISRCVRTGRDITTIFDNIRCAAGKPISFEETLELNGAIDTEDPFLSTMGCHFAQQLNTDYEWNLFFRLLFAVEECDHLSAFTQFIENYRGHFADDVLYGDVEVELRLEARDDILLHLSAVLVQHDDISMFDESTMMRLKGEIQHACKAGCTGDSERVRDFFAAALRG